MGSLRKEIGLLMLSSWFAMPFFFGGHLVNVSLDASLRRKPSDWSYAWFFSINLDVFGCFSHHSDIQLH